MTNEFTLTERAIEKFHGLDGGDQPQQPVAQPVLQILSCKRLQQQNPQGNSDSSNERFRVILSDGKHYMQGMLATQLNTLVPQIQRDSVVLLKQYVINSIQGRKICIVLDMEILGNPSGRFGEPSVYDPSKAPSKPEPVKNAAPVPDKQPEPMKKPPQSVSQAPKADSKTNEMVHPIRALNPYLNRWTIKARVTQKSDMKHWNNARGSGKLFSCTLVDETDEIKANAFNETADRLYPLMEENKLFYISKAQVKPARKAYTNVKNDYEISFDHNSEVVACFDDDAMMKIPKVRYSFVEIAALNDLPKDSMVDVIGVVQDIGEVQHITSKTTNRELVKRDITLLDRSNTCVKMTLWGRQAESALSDASNSDQKHPVVAFKGCKLSDYGGRTLSCVMATTTEINPDIQESHLLRGWYDSIGHSSFHSSISSGVSSSNGAITGNVPGGIGGNDQRKVISQIQDDHLGQSDKPDYFVIKGTTVKINPEKTLWYTACPGDNCQKKVTSEGLNSWRCEKCQRSYNKCNYRYIFQMGIMDYTGTAWVQCFNETGERIFDGHTAEELNQMRESGNQEGFESVLNQAASKTWKFKLRAKQETYNDEMRVRCSVVACDPIDYSKEMEYLTQEIGKM